MLFDKIIVLNLVCVFSKILSFLLLVKIQKINYINANLFYSEKNILNLNTNFKNKKTLYFLFKAPFFYCLKSL